ncbi:MAG: hypothetical protein E7Z64_03170 [Thermoplasmata archaeon]|nr:hypothetical protein [Thermoplasmata archaeon]
MTEESETKRWNSITGAALAAAIALGIGVGIFLGLMQGVFTFLIASGAFLALSFFLRDESREVGGPTTADGAIMAGVLLAGVGVCGFVYLYTEDVMITSVCVIAAMLCASAVMLIRSRRFL